MKANLERIRPDSGGVIKISGRCDPSFDYEWHYHPEVELTLIKGSRGIRYVGDSVETYQDGDLILVGSMLPHSWQSDMATSADGRHRSICVQFPPRLLDPLVGAVPEAKPIQQFVTAAERGYAFGEMTRKLVENMMGDLRALSPRRRFAVLVDILARLSESSDGRLLSRTDFGIGRSSKTRDRVDRICTFISGNYMNGLTLGQIADATHMSESTCVRLFKRARGRTLVEHIQELKIGHACRLLLESDVTITQAAMRSGFESPPYFNRVFRKMKKMSPSEFRRLHRLERVETTQSRG